MRRAVLVLVLWAAAGGVAAQEPVRSVPFGALSGEVGVAVRRVTLSSGGLAQVDGGMTAPAEAMRLVVERAQVADVLRTLVVGGPAAVVSVDLPAAEPVGERSAAGRLLAGDLSDPLTVLGVLVGEVVDLRGGPVALSGRLLAFAPVTVPGGEAGDRPGVRVSVATADGRVAYATFPALDAIAIEGAAVEARLGELLPALSESVDDRRRELTVRLAEPAGATFSFVVPTTVWRPSYRALLGADGRVRLQGWATLENTTGLDWDGVELRLSVGTPVAYAQDVYSPLRTSRPEAPFAVGRTVAPDVPAAEMMVDDGFGAVRSRAFGAAKAPAAAMALEAAPAPADLVTGGPALAGSAATVFTVAGPIDLAAGRTLSVPFLSGAREVRRVVVLSLEDTGQRQPLDALELAFDPAATVPGGLVAVYDADGYVGDARFEGADGGETRILPFAVSADVDAAVTERQADELVQARLADGVLTVTREAVRTVSLALTAAEAVTLVADLPRRPGEAFTAAGVDGAAVTVLGEGAARVRADLPAGRTTLTLTGRRPLSEELRVSDLSTAFIAEVLASGRTDERTRAGLRRVAAVAARLAEVERQIETTEAELADLRQALAVDRDVLDAVDVATPEGAAVRQRLVTRSEEIDGRLRALADLRRERLAISAELRSTE